MSANSYTCTTIAKIILKNLLRFYSYSFKILGYYIDFFKVKLIVCRTTDPVATLHFK